MADLQFYNLILVFVRFDYLEVVIIMKCLNMMNIMSNMHNLCLPDSWNTAAQLAVPRLSPLASPHLSPHHSVTQMQSVTSPDDGGAKK